MENKRLSFTFEVDEKGDNNWALLKKISVKAGESANCTFHELLEKGEWVRVKADQATKATVQFSYAQKDNRSTASEVMFAGLANISDTETNAGLLWGLGKNRRKLGVLAGTASDHRRY